MADFIDFEAVTDQNETFVIETDDEEDEESEVSDIDSFIDDDKKVGENDETLQEEYELSLAEVENFDDFSNFCEYSEDELGKVDEFKNSNKRLEKFEETLFPKSEEHNSFPNSILYAVRFDDTKNIDVCSDGEFEENIETIFNKLHREKFEFELGN